MARCEVDRGLILFINIGRGMTTRLDDLVAAQRAGEIAGAGLDVFEQEPLPADHPLWTMPGVLITPHTAGYGPYLDERRFEILADNDRRFVAGRPLRNIVDKSSWFSGGRGRVSGIGSASARGDLPPRTGGRRAPRGPPHSRSRSLTAGERHRIFVV